MPSYATLTDDDKVEIRHHLGYPGVESVATSVLGNLASIETFFILELALNQVRAAAEPRMRQILATLNTIEQQMIDDLELLAVTQVDEISIRKDEQSQLEGRYLYWCDALCNLLAVERFPFDKRFMSAGINARVHH